MSTKKLAKELGLLRKRSSKSSGLRKNLVANQIFSYLMVIDFESTCWREKNNYSQEIIEFPAVLLNTSTGEIESEFHAYVQPQEHPTLSAFCTELTGITQTQVEAGIPLQICMSRFSRWLQNMQANMGLVFPNNPKTSSASAASQKLCTFLTWSDWDLGVCLQYECRRKQIHKPDVLNSWIDLRSTYRLFYDRKPKGLNGALQDLGIQFAGREHSGLDDARNTAQLAARMMRDGCVMRVTRSLTRAPTVVKHMFGNAAGGNKKENTNPHEEKDTLPPDALSFSIIPPHSRQVGSCSGLVTRDSNKKTNSARGLVPTCQSLVSPKTLLSGPPALRNSSLVLCSTIVSCLSSPDHFSQASAEREAPVLVGEEGREDVFSLGPEERCGSYDDMVLEGSGDVLCGESDLHYASDFDGDGYVWEESDDAVSSVEDTRETGSENNHELERVTSKSAVIPPKTITSQVHVHDDVNKIGQQSKVMRPDPRFVVPKSVTPASKVTHLKTGLKFSTKVQEKSNLSHRNSERKTRLSEKMPLPPPPSFVRSTSVVSHFNQTPKSSFSIYTDPVQPSGRSFCTTKRVLTTLSANALGSRSHCSSRGAQRVTSPLCSCGRRARRQLVSNGGPNQGRGFYCCSARRSGGAGRVQKGCEFFKWESAVIQSSSTACAAAGSSVSLCHISASLRRRPGQRAGRKSC